MSSQMTKVRLQLENQSKITRNHLRHTYIKRLIFFYLGPPKLQAWARAQGLCDWSLQAMCALPKLRRLKLKHYLTPKSSAKHFLAECKKRKKSTHPAHVQSQVRTHRPTHRPTNPSFECSSLAMPLQYTYIHTHTHTWMATCRWVERLKCLQVAADECNLDGSNIDARFTVANRLQQWRASLLECKWARFAWKKL